MLAGFGGANRSKNINVQLSSLSLVGGVDCESGLTPDLKVSGGARIKKTLCVFGITKLHDLFVTELNVTGNSNLNGNLYVTGNIYGNNISPTILVNAGTTFNNISLVNDGVGPSLAVKGLVAGSGISLNQVSNTDIIISATGGGGGWIETATSNLNMNCYTIGNVMAIHVGNLYGKSPINVQDILYIRDTLNGGKITWEGGIEIGNTTTTSNNANSISIGKGAKGCSLDSISIGVESGNIIGGGNQILIGSRTGQKLNAFSRNNVMIGFESGRNISDGIGNTLFGFRAGNKLIYGNDNIGIGDGALINATSAFENTCIGAFGLNDLTNGSGNQTLGFFSGAGITGGNNNTCIGDFSGVGGNNDTSVSVGTNAYCSQSAAISVGSYSLASGNRSVCVGFNSKSSAAGAIAIGADANANIANGIAIGNNCTITGNTNSVGLSCNTASTPAGLLGITLNNNPRQIECHTKYYDSFNNNASTLILTATSPRVIYYTGTWSFINLPDCATLSIGYTIKIINASGYEISAFTSTGTFLCDFIYNETKEFTCISLVNAPSSWHYDKPYASGSAYLNASSSSVGTLGFPYIAMQSVTGTATVADMYPSGPYYISITERSTILVNLLITKVSGANNSVYIYVNGASSSSPIINLTTDGEQKTLSWVFRTLPNVVGLGVTNQSVQTFVDFSMQIVKLADVRPW